MQSKSQAQLADKKNFFFFSTTPEKVIAPFVMNLAKLSLWYLLFSYTFQYKENGSYRHMCCQNQIYLQIEESAYMLPKAPPSSKTPKKVVDIES